MKVSTPTLASSSKAMDADGPPMPVEQTPIAAPPTVPRKPRSSRFRMVSSALSNRAAILGIGPDCRESGSSGAWPRS